MDKYYLDIGLKYLRSYNFSEIMLLAKFQPPPLSRSSIKRWAAGRLRPEPDYPAGAGTGTGIPVPVSRNRIRIIKIRFRLKEPE